MYTVNIYSGCGFNCTAIYKTCFCKNTKYMYTCTCSCYVFKCNNCGSLSLSLIQLGGNNPGGVQLTDPTAAHPSAWAPMMAVPPGALPFPILLPQGRVEITCTLYYTYMYMYNAMCVLIALLFSTTHNCMYMYTVPLTILRS